VTIAFFQRLKKQPAETMRWKEKPMTYFSRLVFVTAVSCFTIGSPMFAASGQQPSTQQRVIVAQDGQTLFSHNSQGYLGIGPGDIDNERAAALKLKEATGAEIVSLDRDGPASKAGLRVHDVIVQMNGQPVAGQEQLRRMLRETPAGRTINLLVSRDGQQQSISVQLADRSTVEQNAWTQPMVVPAPDDDETIYLQGPSGHGLGTGSGFLGTFSLGSSSVGVELDVLGSQLADYFGVKDHQGLLVKHVAENSPASRAGLKAGDVITQANGQKMATLGEWMKMLHANKGKQVQLTLIRNKKEETVTLEARGKNRGELLMPNMLSLDGNIELNDELAQLKDQINPDMLTLQIEPTIDLEDLPPQIQVQPSIDLQTLQKELQDQQQKIEILNLGPIADQMQ
jgi:serine protease Do